MQGERTWAIWIYLAEVKKYVPDADEAAVNAIVKHLGIALKSNDASLVSMLVKGRTRSRT